MNKKEYPLGDTATGQDISRYIGRLQNHKSPYGVNRDNEELRNEAQKEYDEFLRTKWQRIENVIEIEPEEDIRQTIESLENPIGDI